MSRVSRLARLLWHLTAVVQLIVPVMVTLADAELERSARSWQATSHVEDHTRKECTPIHRDDCALCQHLTTPFAKRTPVVLDVPRHLATRATPGALRFRPGAPDDRDALPRAPPIA
jgi:hypothetical protein